jgi:hypothetical protein
MVELVPAKQNCANGRALEVLFVFVEIWGIKYYVLYYLVRYIINLLILKQIMTPKARADIHVNLPALQKLDSMLIVGHLFILKIEIHLQRDYSCQVHWIFKCE